MARKRPVQADSEAEPPSKGLRLTRSRVCAECRKHKTKCETPPGETACVRCQRQGVACVAYDVSQQFLTDDAQWKAHATAEIAMLRGAVEHLLRHTEQPVLASFSADPHLPISLSRSPSPHEEGEETTATAGRLVLPPMRSLYELTKLQNLRHSAGTRPSAAVMEQDFIAQGLVSRETAEALFARFQQVNNRLLWDGILLASPAASLDAVRRASSLLAAVVLAVGALHSPGREEAFHRSYDVFVALARRSALARRHSLDDVAALCIGAFYLANLSWKLSGLASRIAAEIGLHQAYSRLIHANSPHHTDRDNDIYLSHRRVRLWYAVYVCDRQFSIAHGRPPASVDDESTRNLQRFLRGPAAEAGDTRLAAQVALCSILTDAYFAFGSDADRPLGETEMARLRDSTAALDAWRAEWPPRAHDCPAVRSYPAQALVLYFHFARFQLNSLALRGVSAQSPALLSREHRAAASTAIAAAMSTLTLIVDDDDLRAAFPGVPVFTYTMVAFCATFLLKMAATWGRLASGEVYPDEIVSLVHRSADMLARVAAHVNERHLARHIATGMAEMLQQFRAEQAAQDADSLGFALHSSSSSSSAPVLPPASVDESSGVYNFRDLEGTFGFGLDETLLGEMAADSFELW